MTHERRPVDRTCYLPGFFVCYTEDGWDLPHVVVIHLLGSSDLRDAITQTDEALGKIRQPPVRKP